VRRDPAGPIPSGGPAMSETRRAAGDPELTTYRDVQLSPDFSELRRRFRRFVFPMTGLFLAWYFLYVLLADYAGDFMSTKVIGNVNVALLLGLGQFVSTFAITMIYVRWADREVDPAADRMRQLIEGVDK
jgi:uncharacterized membrane protein (DUF485 family)